MIKKIAIVLGILVGLVLIVGLVAPKEMHIERSIIINKPKADVFTYLVFLKNQDQWSPWARKDPEMKKEFRGEDGTVGFVSAWSGNKEIGVGEQEIKKIVTGDRIDYELRFKEPIESTDAAFMTTESINDTQTKVTWGFDGSTPFPGNIVCLVMNIKGKMTDELDSGLARLKGILESE